MRSSFKSGAHERWSHNQCDGGNACVGQACTTKSGVETEWDQHMQRQSEEVIAKHRPPSGKVLALPEVLLPMDHDI
eukprot:3107904-Amphidinium_carterae.1